MRKIIIGMIIFMLLICGSIIYLLYTLQSESSEEINPMINEPLEEIQYEENPPTNLEENKNYNIAIRNQEFSNKEITINSGDTITWINLDSSAHTIKSDSNIENFDSDIFNTNEKYSYKFTKTGTFEYHCSLHESMKGKIIVQ